MTRLSGCLPKSHEGNNARDLLGLAVPRRFEDHQPPDPLPAARADEQLHRLQVFCHQVVVPAGRYHGAT